MRHDVDGELVLPVWEPTGDAAVDAALERLNELDDLDASEHVAVFESVHRQLHQRLSDLHHGQPDVRCHGRAVGDLLRSLHFV